MENNDDFEVCTILFIIILSVYEILIKYFKKKYNM